MSTTTGLTVRYGEGKHIIFVNDSEGFAKVRKSRNPYLSSTKVVSRPMSPALLCMP